MVVWQNGVPQVSSGARLVRTVRYRVTSSDHSLGSQQPGTRPVHDLRRQLRAARCGSGTAADFRWSSTVQPHRRFTFTPARNHLNDADHVAIDRAPRRLSPACDSPGIDRKNRDRDRSSRQSPAERALQINNHDQVFLLHARQARSPAQTLGRGHSSSTSEFGGYASMNELGQIVFLAGPGYSHDSEDLQGRGHQRLAVFRCSVPQTAGLRRRILDQFVRADRDCRVPPGRAASPLRQYCSRRGRR